MNCNFFTFFLLFLPLSWHAQDAPAPYRLAFYNVENLFHPKNDSLKNDDDFTPEGNRYWSFYKYREKYHRSAKAILSIGGWHPPDVVGLAEIENYQVLQDLVNSDVLRKVGYEIVHFESPDRRGIDVAAIYRPNRLKLLHKKALRVKMPGRPDFATRDILYLKLLLKSQIDTLHLLYCHWPSRYGGQAQSEPKRIQAARVVRATYDSLKKKHPAAAVVIAGDFNDEWNNASLKTHLRAKIPGKQKKGDLVNLMAAMDANSGSHRYHGEWTYLDQIIVSANLLQSGNFMQIAGKKARVVRHDFLLENDAKYPGNKPFRTFIGFKHHGGFSDHLPVFIDLIEKE